MAFYTEGLKTGTVASGTLLADSGAQPVGGRTVVVLISSNATAAVRLERRNAADNSILESHTFYVSATVAPPAIANWDIAANERFRLVAAAQIIGDVQGSLQVT